MITSANLDAIQEVQLVELRVRLEALNREREETIRAIEGLKTKLGERPCCWLYELSLGHHTFDCPNYEF
jgi:hypothetical protein